MNACRNCFSSMSISEFNAYQKNHGIVESRFTENATHFAGEYRMKNGVILAATGRTIVDVLVALHDLVSKVG